MGLTTSTLVFELVVLGCTGDENARAKNFDERFDEQTEGDADSKTLDVTCVTGVDDVSLRKCVTAAESASFAPQECSTPPNITLLL